MGIGKNIMDIFKKKEIFIALIFFLLGILFMYFYTRIEVSKNKVVTRKIIDNCVATFKAGDIMTKACNSAYAEVSKCVLNLDTCNLQDSSMKLKIYNDQRKLGEEQMTKAGNDMQAIIDSLK